MKKTQVFLGAALALLLAAACANPLTGPLPGAGSTVTLRADFGSAQGRSLLTSGVNKVEVTYLNAGAPTGVAPILLTDNGSGVWTGQLTLAANGNTQFFMAAYADDEILYTGSKQQTLLGDGSDVVAIEAVPVLLTDPAVVQIHGYVQGDPTGWKIWANDKTTFGNSYYTDIEPSGQFSMSLPGSASGVDVFAFYDLDGNQQINGLEFSLNFIPVLKTPNSFFSLFHMGKDQALLWTVLPSPQIPTEKTLRLTIPAEAVPDGSEDYQLASLIVYQGSEDLSGTPWSFSNNSKNLPSQAIGADQSSVDLSLTLPAGLTGTFQFSAQLFPAGGGAAVYAIGFENQTLSSTVTELTLVPSVDYTLEGSVFMPSGETAASQEANFQVGGNPSSLNLGTGESQIFTFQARSYSLIQVGVYADNNLSGYSGDWAGWHGTTEVTAGPEHWILVTGNRNDLIISLKTLTESTETVPQLNAPGHGFPTNTPLIARFVYGLPDAWLQNQQSITMTGTSKYYFPLIGLARSWLRDDVSLELGFTNASYSHYSYYAYGTFTKAWENPPSISFTELSTPPSPLYLKALRIVGATPSHQYAFAGSPFNSWDYSSEYTYRVTTDGSGEGQTTLNSPLTINEDELSFKLVDIEATQASEGPWIMLNGLGEISADGWNIIDLDIANIQFDGGTYTLVWTLNEGFSLETYTPPPSSVAFVGLEIRGGSSDHRYTWYGPGFTGWVWPVPNSGPFTVTVDSEGNGFTALSPSVLSTDLVLQVRKFDSEGLDLGVWLLDDGSDSVYNENLGITALDNLIIDGNDWIIVWTAGSGFSAEPAP